MWLQNGTKFEHTAEFAMFLLSFRIVFNVERRKELCYDLLHYRINIVLEIILHASEHELVKKSLFFLIDGRCSLYLVGVSCEKFRGFIASVAICGEVTVSWHC